MKCTQCEWEGPEDITVDHFCPECGSVTDYYDFPVSRWDSTPPTIPGWYWCRNNIDSYGMVPTLYKVFRFDDRIMYSLEGGNHFVKPHASLEWLGPVLPPKKENKCTLWHENEGKEVFIPLAQGKIKVEQIFESPVTGGKQTMTMLVDSPWSHMPPSVPGWYWLRRDNSDDVVVWVSGSMGPSSFEVMFVGNDCESDIRDITGMWCGPITPP